MDGFRLAPAEGLPDAPAAGQVRVAACQVDVQIADSWVNVETADRALRLLQEHGVSLAVFPECSLTGYCYADLDEARSHALEPGGGELATVIAACRDRGISAIVGYLERTPGGVANAAAVLGPEGVLGHYRKTHLPHLGVDRWVEAGCGPLEPTVVGDLRVGVLICYDASFPEATRTLALRGADLVALPTNWPAEAVAKADWLPNTRAYENVVYFAAVNRIGTERGYVFPGRSRICDPSGSTLVQGPQDAAALLVADVDPARARTKKIVRRGEEYWVDRIAHRRPELYET